MRNTLRNMKSALLLNDSHLWGVWTYSALSQANLLFDPILSEEIDEDFSNKYRALFVPGGWSKNKLASLDRKAKDTLRDFVEKGGIYVGICGGASLACEEGLGFLKIRRSRERIPSYSGPCRVKVIKEHPLFKNIRNCLFFLWFPPKFEIHDETVQVLGYFWEATPQAFVSDLCLKDHWKNLEHFERKYRIPLDPKKMIGSPLIMEGSLKKGKVLLSLIHFDTPQFKNGSILIENIIKYYQLPIVKSRPTKALDLKKLISKNKNFPTKDVSFIYREFKNLFERVKEILSYAQRNFLFYRRTSYFYQWKRGIRGLELLNLFFMLDEILKCLAKEQISELTLEILCGSIEEVKNLTNVVLEALRQEYESFRNGDPFGRHNQAAEIFGDNLKSYGGLYRILINYLERFLVYLWRN
ncbi:MAG: BPL-N domain-containing protein [Caldimicrobium sp.]|nr:BPL-N domain-containing protein [Caldimicrobium sp.]MCX7874317.1 BPL-N domain-containing protein [Caldimicrobium sp.]MDW8094923.1 BPL-N domain-containing protein [Caldimicrobium sp.]